MSKANPMMEIKVEKQGKQMDMSVSGTAGGSGITVADRLRTPRKIRVTGEVQGGASFDGTQDAEIYTVVEKLTNEELEAMLT